MMSDLTDIEKDLVQKRENLKATYAHQAIDLLQPIVHSINMSWELDLKLRPAEGFESNIVYKNCFQQNIEPEVFLPFELTQSVMKRSFWRPWKEPTPEDRPIAYLFLAHVNSFWKFTLTDKEQNIAATASSLREKPLEDPSFSDDIRANIVKAKLAGKLGFMLG